MKKVLLMTIFVMLLITIAACQNGVQQQPPATTTQVKTVAPTTQPAQTTSDAAVDAVGKDLSNTDSVQNDLNSDNINDSGLSDIQNI